MTDLKGEIENLAKILGKFNTLLSKIARSMRVKINKNIKDET